MPMWNQRKKIFICEHPYVAPKVVRIASRVCFKCHGEYPLNYFVQRHRKKYYFSIVCIFCVRARKRSYYQKDHVCTSPRTYASIIERGPRTPSINGKTKSKFGQHKRDYEKK